MSDQVPYGGQIPAAAVAGSFQSLLLVNPDGTSAAAIAGAAGDVISIPAAGTSLTLLKQTTIQSGFYQTRINPTYGANITISTTGGNWFRVTVTDNAAHQFNSPTQNNAGQMITITERNTSGAPIATATFGAAYKLGAAWVAPATGFSRSITFWCDGTNWIEVFRTAADVAN